MLNFFNCKENKEKDSQMNLLRKKLQVVNTFQDYSYVLKKLNEIEILKKVILDENHLCCFDYISKPFYSDTDPQLSQNFPELYNSAQINKENLINYFIGLLSGEALVGYDEKMFKCLNDQMKEEIMVKAYHSKNNINNVSQIINI
jgi:hypothetical protein